MLRTVGGRPGSRRLLVSYFRAASLRCQASSVAGVTGKTSAQRRRGMNRVSAANQTRSPGSYRIRPGFRRSTAFSCRSTSNSAFFSPSPRTTRTARLNNQRISRQTILSSTWPANQHRTSRAGETSRSTTRSSFRAAQDPLHPFQGHLPGRGDRVSRIAVAGTTFGQGDGRELPEPVQRSTGSGSGFAKWAGAQ